MASPLTAKPKRNPGDGVRDLMMREMEKHLTVLVVGLMACAYLLGLAMGSGLYWLALPVVLAIGALPFWYKDIELSAKRWKQGRDGEMAVGQYLNRLEKTGARVFHDVQGPGFNVDHVIVHESGVYAVETKTHSVPDRGEAVMRFNGSVIYRFGQPLTRCPLRQAKGQARWLNGFIKDETDIDEFVWPTVLFPGWKIILTRGAKPTGWVMEPRKLPGYLAKRDAMLSPDQMVRISAALCAAQTRLDDAA